MTVFGIPIEGAPFEEIERQIIDRPPERGPFWVVTANPEILLEARRDPEYAKVLLQADVRSVDGFGLWLMLKLFGQWTARVPGIDLAESVLAVAEKNGWRVGMIGGGQADTSRKAVDELKRFFPRLVVLPEWGGRVSPEGSDDESGEEARHRLTLFAPQVLFVAFGHPKQERWIARYLADFPTVKVVIGVGGTFDFWAGTARRAPKLLRSVGLEWLWRLMTEPRRIGRIWNAVVVFPLLFLWEKALFRKEHSGNESSDFEGK